MLNKLSVSEIAELSNCSKSYFIQSRQSIGVSPKTLRFYKERLSKYVYSVDYLKATRQDIEKFLGSINPNNNGLATRHASYRVVKTFHRWLTAEYGFCNPVIGVQTPILGKPILPSLSAEQVQSL